MFFAFHISINLIWACSWFIKSMFSDSSMSFILTLSLILTFCGVLKRLFCTFCIFSISPFVLSSLDLLDAPDFHPYQLIRFCAFSYFNKMLSTFNNTIIIIFKFNWIMAKEKCRQCNSGKNKILIWKRLVILTKSIWPKIG